jgi:hypothetical protein
MPSVRLRLARARAAFAQSLRALLRPEGLPPDAAAELESTFGDLGREVLAGPGRLRRVRAEVRAAPPRLLDWMSRQVLEHPAVLYDEESVEELAARQTRSISTAVGALQMALVAGAAASTFEGGPVLALAIDGVVGQVASSVHGFCDWYNTGSYRGWVTRGVVDALPFGASLGRASVRAAARIDGSDLAALVNALRAESAGD